MKKLENSLMMIALYMDDCTIVPNDPHKLLPKSKKNLKSEFEMIDMGKLNISLEFILHVVNNKRQPISISTKYINNILKKFCKESCKSIFTPLETTILNLQRTNLPHLKEIGE
jgi:hypothetical protein